MQTNADGQESRGEQSRKEGVKGCAYGYEPHVCVEAGGVGRLWCVDEDLPRPELHLLLQVPKLLALAKPKQAKPNQTKRPTPIV